MEFSDLVKRRQSTRKYLAESVEKEKLQQCLESARLSPSANNGQPWKFVVVDDPELKVQVANCASGLGMNKFTHEAPVLVAVILEKMKLISFLGSVIQDKEYSLLDIGIAVNQFCLQATDLGLGTCIIGWFDEKAVKKLLHIDKRKRVPLLITVGYSDSPLREKSRKSMAQISSWNGK
jgi:nitroreductase